MLRLTREVRLSILFSPTGPVDPAIYTVVHVTLEGEPDARSSYIENIKVIDEVVRTLVPPVLTRLIESRRWTLTRAAETAASALRHHWSDRLVQVRLSVNPSLFAYTDFAEAAMISLTQRFDFSAAHRLHNGSLDDATNRELFGKCNNPQGHGHNYDLEVTVSGDSPDRVIAPDELARIVNTVVIERFDHKHLNLQIPEFARLIPSVENIARVIYAMLRDAVPAPARLKSVKVWETAKTYAEYAE